MPRSNSLHSSGASITSEEDNAPVPVAAVPSNQSLQFSGVPAAQGTMPFSGAEKFRQVVTKVGHILISLISPPPRGWSERDHAHTSAWR